MTAFLKIENPGQAPVEGFTVLGVSLADTSKNVGVIGQFGSGNKHAVAVLIRNELSSVVFCRNAEDGVRHSLPDGYCRNGEVFINSDLAGAGSVVGGRKALSHRLLVIALDELAHYITGATDNSRDFQNYLLDVAVKLARQGQTVVGGLPRRAVATN